MPSEKRLERVKAVAQRRQEGVVVLEDIHDPHNAAAVLRTADAFGIQKVYFIQPQFSLTPITKSLTLAQQIKFRDKIWFDKTGAEFIFEKGKKFNPRKLGKVTSASANKWLDFEIFTSTKQCFSKLKRQRYHIVGTVLDKGAKSIFKTKFTNPKTALVFGNEHNGLSSAAIEMSDHHVYIPMQGFVQSLNLSVTAAICLYEMSRQRKGLQKKYLISPKQQNQLIKVWQKQ